MGKGYTYRCPKCGFEEQHITGVGFMTDAEAFMERGNILAGIYGPKAQKALQGRPEAAVSVERTLYQCGACGKLENRLAVKIAPPVGVPIRQRCNCGKIMRRIRAGKEMFCPICREPLKKTDIVAAVLWD